MKKTRQILLLASAISLLWATAASACVWNARSDYTATYYTQSTNERYYRCACHPADQSKTSYLIQLLIKFGPTWRYLSPTDSITVDNCKDTNFPSVDCDQLMRNAHIGC